MILNMEVTVPYIFFPAMTCSGTHHFYVAPVQGLNFDAAPAKTLYKTSQLFKNEYKLTHGLRLSFLLLWLQLL
jgi:hypothetical protein